MHEHNVFFCSIILNVFAVQFLDSKSQANSDEYLLVIMMLVIMIIDSRLHECTMYINPFLPTVAFKICYPRDAVSRTANVERNGGQKWVNTAV